MSAPVGERVVLHACWAPKLGASAAEWEDGIALSAATGRLAVADGASASFDAGPWARRLVARFVAEPPEPDPDGVERWAAECARAWADDRAVPAGTAAAPAPWYVDEAAVRGAFATFAGLGLSPADEGGGVRWWCVAVGDCCLFHVRDGRLVRSFPLERAHDFDDQPALLSSVAFGGRHGGQRAAVATGAADPGDALVLATDALATWALARSIGSDEVWALLARIDHDRFADLVERARLRGEMADDDVALARATVV